MATRSTSTKPQKAKGNLMIGGEMFSLPEDSFNVLFNAWNQAQAKVPILQAEMPSRQAWDRDESLVDQAVTNESYAWNGNNNLVAIEHIDLKTVLIHQDISVKMVKQLIRLVSSSSGLEGHFVAGLFYTSQTLSEVATKLDERYSISSFNIVYTSSETGAQLTFSYP
jgi:hypothetical protein